MIVLSYGGGTDSTALLVEAYRRGIRPDLIVWADTGSERPETYAYLPIIGKWLAERGWPAIETVRWIRQDGRFVPLHEACLAHNDLPSVAYGHAGCSSKWKRQPLDKYIDHHPAVAAALAAGQTVERWVGYNADEDARAANLPAPGALLLMEPDQQVHLFGFGPTVPAAAKMRATPYVWRAPLYEFGIDREDARRIIQCEGLPLPGKSACWCCPNSSPGEVKDLRRKHPPLFGTALLMEAGADLTVITGLGRSWKWADLDRQELLFDSIHRDEADIPCGCST